MKKGGGLSVVIPNWNGEEKLRANLGKVSELEGASEIIVSDDASTDASCDVVEKEFPDVKLVKRQRNGGFSSNVNTGIAAAKEELVFLLNSDAVPERDCLRYVLDHFKKEQVFSVGLSAGGSWNWAKFEDGQFIHNQYGDSRAESSHQTLWASGGSMVFRKSVFEKLGGMDELFDPFYVEDTDLGYRATKRGYINIFEPKARVEHYKQVGVIAKHFDMGKVLDMVERNTLLLVWKNITDGEMMRKHYLYLVKRTLRHPRYIGIIFRALFKLPGLLEKRKEEAKFAKLSDREIFGMYT